MNKKELIINKNKRIFGIYDIDLTFLNLKEIIDIKNEFRVLIYSNHFNKIDKNMIENIFSFLIDNDIVEIFIYGKGAKALEHNFDHLIVNKFIDCGNDKYLGITTVSDESELLDILNTFNTGGYSFKDTNTLVKENYIIGDSSSLFKKIISYFKSEEF